MATTDTGDHRRYQHRRLEQLAEIRLQRSARRLKLAATMDEEPDLYILRPPDRDDGWRAERERQREESRRRHLERLVSVLAVAGPRSDDPPARAEAVLDGFFITRHRETDEPCTCSCHPQLPEADQHDYGSACPCRLTAAERRVSWDACTAERDAYWASPEGREIQAREQSEEDALAAWLATDPGVSIAATAAWPPSSGGERSTDTPSTSGNGTTTGGSNSTSPRPAGSSNCGLASTSTT